uniref:Uncharacterized protein n=1 Tax=Timema cristinae TaxID=61476 RepID=A0A7R9CEG9_TIMCR|nr:unnamed protein product [Timema cristinae]
MLQYQIALDTESFRKSLLRRSCPALTLYGLVYTDYQSQPSTPYLSGTTSRSPPSVEEGGLLGPSQVQVRAQSPKYTISTNTGQNFRLPVVHNLLMLNVPVVRQPVVHNLLMLNVSAVRLPVVHNLLMLNVPVVRQLVAHNLLMLNVPVVRQPVVHNLLMLNVPAVRLPVVHNLLMLNVPVVRQLVVHNLLMLNVPVVRQSVVHNLLMLKVPVVRQLMVHNLLMLDVPGVIQPVCSMLLNGCSRIQTPCFDKLFCKYGEIEGVSVLIDVQTLEHSMLTKDLTVVCSMPQVMSAAALADFLGNSFSTFPPSPSFLFPHYMPIFSPV